MSVTPISIADHYDTCAVITGEDSPAKEFDRWKKFAENDLEWRGDEFTLENFAQYIGSLNE